MYIRINATPGAKKEQFKQVAPDRYHIHVKEPAERNMANNRIRELLARELGLTEGVVKLISGHRSPHKIFSIPDEM